MSKPIQIRAHAQGYTVHVDGAAAQRYGAKKRKKPIDGNVHIAKGGVGVSIVRGLEATPVEMDTAKTLAHQIGRYMLGFGDLVFAYTDAPEGFWAE